MVVPQNNAFVLHNRWSSSVVTVEWNLPCPASFLAVTDKELLLVKNQVAVFNLRSNHREPWLVQPGLHDASDIHAGSVPQCLPQIISGSIVVLVGLKVVLQPLPHCIVPNQGPYHDQHPGTLSVHNGTIKDGIDFGRILNVDVDWLHSISCVPLKGQGSFGRLE